VQRAKVRTIYTMRTDDLDFQLPRELIATSPPAQRDGSRLLVVQRSDPTRLEHRAFSDLPALLAADDLLVFNRSRVVPARLVGENSETGGKVTGLYLMDGPEPGTWIAMLKAKRSRPGRKIMLKSADGNDSGVLLELIERVDEHGPGSWVLRVEDQRNPGCPIDTFELLNRAGWTPLPPYILSERNAREESVSEETDRARYQTVFAGDSDAGSVAAPTAGLHFNEQVFSQLKSRSVRTSEVVLHVGAGTFKPVETETLDEHPMHAEWCSMGQSGVYGGEFADGKPASGRVFAVGSTSARTLESYANLEGECPEYLETRILIKPGYRWRWVDGMVTNFHLPRSTLLAMVASILDVPGEVDGVERVQEIYSEAIAERYRFYSYGDAMVILP
jgi:S-adenosylmethionine:tRNA ribosyltransferase-isomerase